MNPFRTKCSGLVRLVFGLAAIAAAGFASLAAAAQVPTGFTDQVIVGGLDQPTSFAFLPDRRILFCELNTGRIRMVVNGRIAATDPVVTVSGLSTGNERGLLGIAVDPRWPAVPWVYANYTHDTGTQRIVRYIATGDLDNPNGENLTLGSGLALIDDLIDVAQNHNAGCMRFGPDGCLYAALGDDADACDAADTTSLRGAILRLRVTTLPGGSGSQVARSVITPPDNPFVNSANPNTRLVHSFGYRNPFRFQVDPATGQIVVGDVGEGAFEELSLADPGDFMGWPWREGNLVDYRAECQETSGWTFTAPIRVEAHDEPVGYAIISAGRYRPVTGAPANWPAAYHGDVFYGQYYEGYLRRLEFNGSSWQLAAPVAGQPNATDWGTGFLAATDFQVGPDGSLWWMAQFAPDFANLSGSLRRVLAISSTAVDGAGPRAGALAISPNPFRGSVELAFRQPAEGAVRLAIHDLSGRRLRTLNEGVLPAGDHRLQWDGRDDSGRAASAGVYFARIERANEAPITARLLRVR